MEKGIRGERERERERERRKMGEERSHISRERGRKRETAMGGMRYVKCEMGRFCITRASHFP